MAFGSDTGLAITVVTLLVAHAKKVPVTRRLRQIIPSQERRSRDAEHPWTVEGVWIKVGDFIVLFREPLPRDRKRCFTSPIDSIRVRIAIMNFEISFKKTSCPHTFTYQHLQGLHRQFEMRA